MAWTAPRTYAANEVVTAAILNVDHRDNLLALSSHGHTGAAGDGADDLTGLDTLTFDDQAGDPSVTGRLQRNGADLYYYDGASAKKLTNHTHPGNRVGGAGTDETTLGGAGYTIDIAASISNSYGNQLRVTRSIGGDGTRSAAIFGAIVFADSTAAPTTTVYARLLVDSVEVASASTSSVAATPTFKPKSLSVGFTSVSVSAASHNFDLESKADDLNCVLLGQAVRVEEIGVL